MDFEKKYNDALKRARNLYPSVHEHNKKMLEQIFPELRESEDERIRKGLIEVVSDIAGGWPFEEHRITKKEALAYLEKQKEQKPNPSNSVGLEQNPAEWSDEDMGFLYEVMTMVQSRGGWVRSDDAIENVKSWLNALPERFNLQPKQEWSEEDEERIQSILFSIGYYKEEYPNKKDYSKDINWLKSLRPKSKEKLAKMLQDEYNKGREEGERIGHTKGYNEAYKDAEKAYNKAVSYHQ